MPVLKVLTIGMSAAASDGGLERYFFELFDALPRAGTEPRGLVVGRPDGSNEGGPAVSAFARSTDPMLRRWFMMRRAAPAHVAAADVAVSHFAPNAFPVARLLSELPFVVHFHGPWALESLAEGGARRLSPLKHAVERRVYDRADRFIVLSAAFGEILQRTYGVAPERIRTIRGGVNLERFGRLAPRAEARERLGWPAGRPIVMTVRRLVPSKGVEDLIDATVAVRRAVPDVLVVIVGGGPLRSALEERARERGLEGNVRFAGRLSDDDLALAYRASDLFVVPSIALEGFGLVVIESLASGTPALVTNVGGLPETVRDLDPALVLEGYGPDILARGIASALRGTLAVPTEDACIAHASVFDWRSVASDVHAVYREAQVAHR